MSQSQTTLLLSYPAGYQRQNDPVNDRAWTFQEWLLPRRIASFSYRGVEMLDRRIPPHPVANAEARLSDAPWRHGQLYTLSPDIEHRRTAWVSTRAEYSRRKLTVGSDKLLAIGAVAEELSRSYKGAYLAGLWEEELQAELQWSREWGGPGYQSGDMARPEGYIAPSWSWAAVVGAVEDHGVEAEKSSYNGGVDFSILDCSVQHAIPGFEFGAVVAGHLVVCGRIKSFIWRPEQDTPVKTCDGFLAICEVNDGDDQEWQVGEAMLDAEDDVLVDGCEVQCLAMAVVERVPDRPGTEGMVLVGIDGGRYRRVGYFRMFGMTQFDDVEVQEATIV
jgi:hypothetical protein